MKSLLTYVTLFFATVYAATTIAGEFLAKVTDLENKPVIHALVILKPVSTKHTIKSKTKIFNIDQIDKEFIPRISAITIGTPVLFPNKDNIRHHVYSFSPAKRFELPLYTGVPAQPVVFDQAGIVKLGCNIHDWMQAYVYVTDTPYFGQTKTDGTVRIGQLPAGRYTVQVWHPDMTATEEFTQQQLSIDNTGNNKADWHIELKPSIIPIRAPVPIQQGYR